MQNSVIHHLGIGLFNPQTAEPFFDQLFKFLGLEKEQTTEAFAGWKGRGTRFYLYPVKAGEPPGALQHLAFSARSRSEVDEFARWATTEEIRIRITSGPKAYPEYGGDYYATFFEGPEGLRLEMVWLAEKEASKK